jgi:predicted component of type VI protein secretion system
MRRKVEEMAKLLAARKTKLKAIESSIDKKADVVEKVEKMIGRKERVAQYFEKQKFQALAFEKNLPNDNK